jgi:YesN/AraC family two-component response regulator
MLDARQMYETSISETLLRRFSQNVLQLDMASALVDLKQLLESISRGSYKSFQVNVLQLAVALDEVLNKLQVNNGIEKTVTIDSLLYTVSSFESVESLYGAFELAILQAEQVVVQNKNSHQSSVVTEMQEIIKRMYGVKDFSIITVSEMIGMNASYLGKLFKRNTGTTFIEFLHMVRMEAACNLLATTDLQIVDVVSSVGFSDVPYFYKVFKKANGCTPSTYRQQHGS